MKFAKLAKDQVSTVATHGLTSIFHTEAQTVLIAALALGLRLKPDNSILSEITQSHYNTQSQK